MLCEAQRLDLDQREVVPSSAKVEQGAVDAPVQQRRQRNDQRLRRQNPTGNEARVAPAEEPTTLAGEDCVDDPVVLSRTGGGEYPFQFAAEVEQADPIAPAQIRAGECCDRPNGEVERRFLIGCRLGERVEERLRPRSCALGADR